MSCVFVLYQNRIEGKNREFSLKSAALRQIYFCGLSKKTP